MPCLSAAAQVFLRTDLGGIPPILQMPREEELPQPGWHGLDRRRGPPHPLTGVVHERLAQGEAPLQRRGLRCLGPDNLCVPPARLGGFDLRLLIGLGNLLLGDRLPGFAIYDLGCHVEGPHLGPHGQGIFSAAVMKRHRDALFDLVLPVHQGDYLRVLKADQGACPQQPPPGIACELLKGPW